jgi:hypothetical protein
MLTLDQVDTAHMYTQDQTRPHTTLQAAGRSSAEHRAQSTEHRAQSTEHRQDSICRHPGVLLTNP